MEISPLLLVISGFALLWAGSEALIRGAVTAAHALSVPPVVIGLTIISLGTSAPELTVSVSATLDGETDVAIGNVIGSNIANILLILGAMAMVSPFTASIKHLRRDGSVMLGASLLLVALAAYGTIDPRIGVLLLVGLAAYIAYLYFAAPKEIEANADEGILNGGLWVGVPLIIIGLATILIGAQFIVDGAIDFAKQIGVSSGVIALALVAFGTSLPELAISVAAVLRKQASLAIGNVIGSNIANILLILGASALVAPLPFPPEMLARDIWIMLAVAALGVYVVGRGAMSRRVGGVFLALYTLYIVILFL